MESGCPRCVGLWNGWTRHNGLLHFVAFLHGAEGRGILAVILLELVVIELVKSARIRIGYHGVNTQDDVEQKYGPVAGQ